MKIVIILITLFNFGLLILLFIEIKWLSKWKLPFYKKGLTIFNKHIFNIRYNYNIDIDKLNNEFSKGIWTSIEFKQLSENEFGFREKPIPNTLTYYLPIMRCLITNNSYLKTISFKGIINWGIGIWIIASINSMIMLYYENMLSFPFFLLFPFFIFILFMCYIIQYKRYNKVVEAIDKMINQG
jgi:hypothetical protein